MMQKKVCLYTNKSESDQDFYIFPGILKRQKQLQETSILFIQVVIDFNIYSHLPNLHSAELFGYPPVLK